MLHRAKKYGLQVCWRLYEDTGVVAAADCSSTIGKYTSTCACAVAYYVRGSYSLFLSSPPGCWLLKQLVFTQHMNVLVILFILFQSCCPACTAELTVVLSGRQLQVLEIYNQ
jgi:hypothetical protein